MKSFISIFLLFNVITFKNIAFHWCNWEFFIFLKFFEVFHKFFKFLYALWFWWLISLHFKVQSKFKYINTTKENNKKILVNWTILNDGVQHNTDYKFNDKDLLINNKYIDASLLIAFKDNDHIILFYTLSELAYLIDLNNDNYTKSNLVFLIANIINYCYTIFNKQLNHIEFKKFNFGRFGLLL